MYMWIYIYKQTENDEKYILYYIYKLPLILFIETAYSISVDRDFKEILYKLLRDVLPQNIEITAIKYFVI